MKIWSLLLLLLITNILFSQDIPVVNNGLANRLYDLNVNREMLSFTKQKEQVIKLENNFTNYNQSFLRNKKGSFILVDGTGRIYKAMSKSKDTVYYQRIDSTHFYGYNGQAININYRDTIFSFGGFGYWRKNGQLRYYSEQYHEWDIIPLNEEVPTTNTLYYFDSLNSELYYLQIPFSDLASNSSTNEYVIYKLNLVNRTNTRLGKIKEEFTKYFPITSNYSFAQINSMKGVLVNFEGENQYFIDLVNNTIFKLTSSKLKKTFYGNSKNIHLINFFEKDGWLYYNRSDDSNMQLDSVKISSDDFVQMNTEFYIPEGRNKMAYGLGIFGVAVLGSILFYQRRKKILTAKEGSLNSTSDIDNFKPIELDLIEKIYKKSLEGKSYSVEDFNATLGLSKKSLEIQKKIRTETLNRINHRFKILFDTEDELTERIRLEEDRRFYKYIINEENGTKALGL